MIRTASPELLAHIAGHSTTTCRLLKFTLKNGDVFGIATLDVPVPYDDGTADGEIAYSATQGFDPSALRTDTGFSVDNAEASAILAQELPGITREMVDAGDIDDARWVCYLVNFRDLSMGHMILGGGDVGEVRLRYGVMWMPELLSYMSRLKRPIGHSWSIRGRCIFGSPADSQTGCGVDVSGMWVEGEVASVGPETSRTFTGDAVATPHSFPGRVEWLTGPNAGRLYATEAVAGLVITLAETTAYPIEDGDTYRIRPDCGKRWQEDCVTIWNNGARFKGEPYIPIADESEVSPD